MTDRPPHLDAWRTAPYDAIIVGGGPAGLSAALVLGRANKRVLVVDNDRPANAVSQGVGGLLGHDRVKPADLRCSGRRQLEEHANIEVRHGAVDDVEPTADGFVVTPTDAAPVRAHAVVLAHGAALRPAAAAWDRGAVGGGRSSAARSATAGRSATRPWRSTAAAPAPCARRSCSPVGATTSCCARTARRTPAAPRWPPQACGSAPSRSPGLLGTMAASGKSSFRTARPSAAEALFVSTRRDQPNGLAAALGCDLTEAGTIVTDADGRTKVAGVYAAGDAATAHRGRWPTRSARDRASRTPSRSTASRRSSPRPPDHAGESPATRFG